ncbi:NAD(P)H-dependent oxidoreductase [Pontimicrobium aquaticum]|uniref:NAD(P)H-dependent oxidoreductase n=1 Tax=Pontimicrobium aquaticum TaxID=2565367 RepID=A0A4U0ET16_9FLAO|nr:NAD(P)H-dependent oxidoreductase [Pontimicrobium aquaticum]TJY33482.1 NAD(P)H-dependent oxidoreductase [Pontimicrobium aquaticum]
MDIIESLKWRYATKKFDSEAIISDEKIDVIKQAFNLTASSYGMQPVTLLFIKDKDIQQALVKHTKNQQQVAQASHVLVFCVTKITKESIVEYFNRVKEVRDTPNDILQPFKEYLIDSFSEMTIEEIEHYCNKQAYLAMGNLLTVCAIEGVDACPMEGFDPKGYDEFLSLNEKGLKSVLVMPIGYRAKDDMFADFKKVRKKITDSVIEIKKGSI